MIKNIPNAINKIQWAREITSDKPEFEVKIWKDEELVYHNKAYAGVINLVQSEVELDFENPDEPTFEGDSQVFGFGTPIDQTFAMDQLRVKAREIWEIAYSQIDKLIKKVKDEAKEE